jgi:hypothetical protein
MLHHITTTKRWWRRVSMVVAYPFLFSLSAMVLMVLRFTMMQDGWEGVEFYRAEASPGRAHLHAQAPWNRDGIWGPPPPPRAHFVTGCCEGGDKPDDMGPKWKWVVAGLGMKSLTGGPLQSDTSGVCEESWNAGPTCRFQVPGVRLTVWAPWVGVYARVRTRADGSP